jgi:hypothetical protein
MAVKKERNRGLRPLGAMRRGVTLRAFPMNIVHKHTGARKVTPLRIAECFPWKDADPEIVP